jgi:hypothetical protein
MAVTNGSASPGTAVGVTKYQDLAVELRAAGAAAASTTNTLTVTFAFSADGVDYETTGSQVLTMVGDGSSATNVAVKTLTTGPAGYIKLKTVAWNGTTNLTYAAVKYSLKPQRNGR